MIGLIVYEMPKTRQERKEFSTVPVGLGRVIGAAPSAKALGYFQERGRAR